MGVSKPQWRQRHLRLLKSASIHITHKNQVHSNPQVLAIVVIINIQMHHQ